MPVLTPDLLMLGLLVAGLMLVVVAGVVLVAMAPGLSGLVAVTVRRVLLPPRAEESAAHWPRSIQSPIPTTRSPVRTAR